MEIAQIIGTVVSTIKVEKIENTKLKIAQAVNPYGEKSNTYYLVEDAIGVGIGETVLLADDGDTVSQLVGRENVPIRASIVAKIDKINMTLKLHAKQLRDEKRWIKIGNGGYFTNKGALIFGNI